MTDPSAAEALSAEEALKVLRAAAVKAGAHIVVTNDYPDGVKAFGILCDAIDVADAALEALDRERAAALPTLDDADDMCPNCITPWKCNGPHLHEQTVNASRRLSSVR